MWYDVDRNCWDKRLLQVPRYSAMVTLVVAKKNYVLVAGGIDKDGRVMKSWELYDP